MNDPGGREFRPELISRRGEGIAWGCAGLVGATWLLLVQLGEGVNLLVPILAGALLLTALSISLGNWTDRSTRLSLGPEGLDFRNGLRTVNLPWADVRELRVLPAPWGKKVQVIGRQAYFGFNTLGEVRANGRTLGRTGFAEGDRIVQEVIARARLEQLGPEAAGLPADSHYYARR